MRAGWFVLGGVVLVGCDGPAERIVDANEIGDSEGLIDTLVQDGCGDSVGLFADEGGEVRLEYVTTPSTGADAAMRATAFAYADPGTQGFFPIPSFMGCTDMTDKTHWPVAQNPIEQRTYFDLGNVIISGGPVPLQIPRSSSTGGAQDPYFRLQVPNEWFSYNDTPTGTDAGDYVAADTRYDVIFGGSDNFPARIYDEALYMPPAFDLIAPDLSDTPYVLTDSAHTFSWSIGTPQNLPSDLKIFTMISFTGDKGPALVCIEEDDGEITIPQDKIDVVRSYYAGGGGTISRQKFAHALRELVPTECGTGTRLDVIGVMAYEQDFSVP